LSTEATPLRSIRRGSTASSKRLTRVQAYERKSEVPLLLLAGAFLVAYAWPVLDQQLGKDAREMLNVVSWTVWGAFAVDFAIRLHLAERRRAYARQHWYDVALIALPMLRPLRLLRVLALARVLNRSASRNLTGQVTTYAVGTALMLVGLGALAVLDAEESAPGANIKTFGDALWWSATTVTTVGYGDHYPVTTAGRFVAVGLMIVGIATVGAVTAAVAAWIFRQVQLEDGAKED
jgi:voltage-gated potassium channel